MRILDQVRCKQKLLLPGFVVMPEHVHLPMSAPPSSTASKALQVLKQRVSRTLRKKRKRAPEGQLQFAFAALQTAERHFWQRRFYVFNVWSEKKFEE